MTKAKSKDDKKPNQPAKKRAGCYASASPGPRYVLPTLTGYPGHDATKYRNPAYSLRSRQTSQPPCGTPGPKYNIEKLPRLPAPEFTFGYRQTSIGKSCTPGPYKLPDNPRYPIFSLSGRTMQRSGGATPGPYVLPPVMGCRIPDKTASPCFTLGARPYGTKCDASPGPGKIGELDVVKPKAPRWSLGARQIDDRRSCGPGPKYRYCIDCWKCAPNFSFGMKHSECAPPLITECDEKC